MADYICPFCGNPFDIRPETAAIYRMNFDSAVIPHNSPIPHLSLVILRCSNFRCGKESVLAEGHNGYLGNSCIDVYPPAAFQRFPDYIPKAIREDYEEASLIVGRSPKAAATLCRRCLQGMIHDFWNIHEKNLNAEITQLKGRIPLSHWQAIDTVRRTGNIGAHMEHDVNVMLEISFQDASTMIRLIELLIKKWYVAAHEEAALLSEVAVAAPKAPQSARQNEDHKTPAVSRPSTNTRS